MSTKTGLVAHGDAAVALGSDRAVGLWILSVQAPRTTLMRVVALKIQRRGRTRSSLRVDASRTDGRLDRQERRRTRPTCGYQMPRTIMRPACRPRARVACTNADGWSRVSPVSAALVGYPTRRGWLPAPRGGSSSDSKGIRNWAAVWPARSMPPRWLLPAPSSRSAGTCGPGKRPRRSTTATWVRLAARRPSVARADRDSARQTRGSAWAVERSQAASGTLRLRLGRWPRLRAAARCTTHRRSHVEV